MRLVRILINLVMVGAAQAVNLHKVGLPLRLHTAIPLHFGSLYFLLNGASH